MSSKVMPYSLSIRSAASEGELPLLEVNTLMGIFFSLISSMEEMGLEALTRK